MKTLVILSYYYDMFVYVVITSIYPEQTVM